MAEVELVLEAQAGGIAEHPRDGAGDLDMVAKLEHRLGPDPQRLTALDHRAGARNVAQADRRALEIVVDQAGPDQRMTAIAAQFVIIGRFGLGRSFRLVWRTL